MAETTESNQLQKQSSVIPVRMNSSGNQVSPVLANLTSVSIAQGLAHVEFVFVEPSVFASIAQGREQGGPLPQEVPGVLATRVALPLEAAIHLQRQLTRLLRQASVKGQATS